MYSRIVITTCDRRLLVTYRVRIGVTAELLLDEWAYDYHSV